MRLITATFCLTAVICTLLPKLCLAQTRRPRVAVIKPIARTITVPLIKKSAGKVDAKRYKAGRLATKPMKLKRTSMTASKADRIMRKRISKSQLTQLRTRQKLTKLPKTDNYRPFSSAGGVKITPFKSPIVRKGDKIYAVMWHGNGEHFPAYYEATGYYSLARQAEEDRLTTAKSGEFSAFFCPSEEPGWKNLSKTFIVTVETSGLYWNMKDGKKRYKIFVGNQLLQVNRLDATHYSAMFTSETGRFYIKTHIPKKSTIGSITVKRFELN